MNRPILFALNHLLGQAAWARDRLASFAGRRVLLVCAPLRLPLVIASDGLLAADQDGDTADVTIELPADTPLRLCQGGTSEVMKAAHITGAADLAEAVGFVLRNLRWDGEEDLSRVVGDLAAHRLTRGFRAFAAWQRETGQRLAENLAEYWVHEKPTVLGAAAFKVFTTDLAELQARLDQIEGRLSRLD